MNNSRAKSRWLRCGLALALAAGPVTTYADQFGLQLGGGIAERGIKKGDLGVVWNPNITWWDTGNWHFALLGEFHLAQWHTSQGNINPNITEFGVNPLVRFVKNGGDIRPYIEAGAGVRGLSHAVIATDYSVATAFQFTEIAGVGIMFGQRQQYQLGYRFQHVSNAGIKEPNPGVNFHEIYAQYNF
jgi:lipid A 3-O-deacylase